MSTETTTRNLRKERIGIVTSNKMEKSIVVSVARKEKHPMYGKFVTKTKKFVAHDEEQTCNIGEIRCALWKLDQLVSVSAGDWLK